MVQAFNAVDRLGERLARSARTASRTIHGFASNALTPGREGVSYQPQEHVQRHAHAVALRPLRPSPAALHPQNGFNSPDHADQTVGTQMHDRAAGRDRHLVQ
jgi:hypothetical protein